ncbi:hypothetical protein G6O06_004179 [Salmonella enterica subsp. enterica]|uniref:hypothetical protein n=1 Tax=Salmonella enterica TaxID=28901 RepID=UPI0003BDC1D8|nr:hypothetical protein [Salmonella enterica subsp. enterica serovar Cerro]EIE5970874.1 hypothetical protein [Salmonella enterica]ESG76335.1 hypothetical protein SEEM1594_02709 [Salmonella enterica subsp. enterica serovar Muenchen str. baa1594]EEO3522716.1 hypothetical protein [Salmonella enterica subsp. enterica serovar Cerro]EIC4422384.1 hypothetical protein [Salmonella enterica subsp. enterica serovar Cerro]
MKIFNTSLKNTGILFSLVLLSPGIMAETLNVQYDRGGILSLEPRVGLQAKACHSKADPMNIRVRFGPMFIGGDINVTIAINGNDYNKNYALFSSLPAVKNNAGIDLDFLVPFNVSIKGNASGTEGHNVTTAAIPKKVTYGDVVCFARNYHNIGTGRTDTQSSGGYLPILTTTMRGGNYDDFLSRSENLGACEGREDNQSEDYYWPDYHKRAKAFQDSREDGFLFKHKFYRSKKITEGTPSTTKLEFGDFSSSVGNEIHDGDFVYRFPLGSGSKDAIMNILGGDFLLRLNNRNISSMTLTVSTGGASEVWTWKAAVNDGNNLHLTRSLALGVTALASDNSDPYAKYLFYAKNDFYKGTLAGKSALNQAYTDYINNTVPLSLPQDSAGDINLVNTDNLIFTIGQKPNTQGYGSMTFSAYGQPLKFGPLLVGSKEVANAMQMRNACY